MLRDFDQPTMEVNCTRRSQSTVALPALTQLNSDFMINQALRFSDRLRLLEQGDPVANAVTIALGRTVQQDESQYMNQFVEDQRAFYAMSDDPNQSGDTKRFALADLCHMLLSSNEFLYVD